MVNTDNETPGEQSSGKDSAKKYNNGNPSGVDRRVFLQYAGAGSGAAMLAGCISGEGTQTEEPGSDGGDGGDGGDGDDGGDGGGSFQLDGPIRIGAMGPEDSPYGASILRAAEVTAAKINSEGGIAGADVEILTKDTEDDPSVARSAYQELTTGQDVDYTVGIFGSEQLLAIMDDMAQQQKLHLSTGAATPESTRLVSQQYDQYKYHFRVGPTNSRFLGTALMEFAEANFDEMGWDSIALLVEDYQWTGPVRDYLDENIGDLGVDVAVEKVVPEGTEDFTPIYDEMEEAGVDGCYTVLAHIGTPSLVQWAQQQRPFGYGGIHVGAQLPAFYELTQGAARYTFTQTTATPTSEVTSKTVPFAETYFEEFDSYPVYTGYSTHDALYLIKHAIETAESTDSDDLIPVLEGVNQGSFEYTGTAGVPSFYGRDHEFTHDLRYNEHNKGLFFQWQEVDGSGSQQALWPEDLAEAEYQSPPWV